MKSVLNKKVSIIMPVFNTNIDLLKKSVDSLEQQTLKNIEVIIVDDKSTNAQIPVVLDELQAKYENIKVVHHEVNGGSFRARLTGIKEATGDYIAFIDSDDTATQDYYRTLLNAIVKDNSDIVVSPFILDNPRGEKKYYPLDPFRNNDFNLENDEVFDAFMQQQGACYSWYIMWNKIYKKELVEKIYDKLLTFSDNHPNLIMTDDIAFNTLAFLNAKKLTSCKGEGIYYLLHDTQSTNNGGSFKKWERNLNDTTAVFDFMEEILKQNSIYEKHLHNFTEWKNCFARNYYGNGAECGNKLQAGQLVKTKFKVEKVEFWHEVDNYYYSISNDCTGSEVAKENLIRNIVAPETKVVSFDIFDTLLTRKVYTPKDIFALLNLEYNKKVKGSYRDFKKIREIAEQNTRCEIKKEEITLDEIYNYIETKYGVSKEDCKFLKEKEIELELKYITTRNFGRKLYDIAKNAGKKVIFTSDMYLDRQTIKKLLEKCGYCDDDTFYLSCDNRQTKHVGTLYAHVLKEENISANEMVHIGDNFHSDVEIPTQKGIRAFHLPNAHDMFNQIVFVNLFCAGFQHIETYHSSERYQAVRNMLGLVKNKFFDDPFVSFNPETVFNSQPALLGYFAVGMDLIALNDWLYKNSKESKKIHFVARDGHLPMLAYEELKNRVKGAPLSNYLYVSRKALLLLDVKNQNDLLTLEAKMGVCNLSPRKLLNYFTNEVINEENFLKNLKKYNYKENSNFESVEDFYKAVAIFDNTVVDYKKHTDYCNKIIKNLKAIISPNDKFFDIGYSGRAESVMSNILGYPIDSMYIHTNSDIAKIRSKLSGFDLKTFIGHVPITTGIIREHIFMKTAPSLVAYTLDSKNKLDYVFEEYKPQAGSEAVTLTVQSQALSFVKDFYDNYFDYLDWFDLPCGFVTFPYEQFLNIPKPKDRDIFSCVYFEDDMGLGQTIKATNYWRAEDGLTPQNLPPLYNVSVKIAGKLNKWFPQGSRRRRFAKKFYNFLRKIKRK